MAIHVYPLNDYIDHVVDSWPDTECPCEPTVKFTDDDGEILSEAIIVHNALDGRQ